MSEDKRYDILGRELHNGDICVGKGTGRDVYGMAIGVWCGKSIAFQDGYKRSMSDVFKVVNPSKEEIEIANRIKEDLNKRKEENKNKKAKCIPLSQLIVGGIYKDINSNYYIYLGKRKISVTEGKRILHEENGNCFGRLPLNDRIGLNHISKSEILKYITTLCNLGTYKFYLEISAIR